MDPPSAVRTSAVPVNLLDDVGQGFIGHITLRSRTVPPGVVPAPGDLQEPGHDRHGMVRLLSIDEAERFYRVSRAKKAAASFKISRSSRKTLFSRRSFRSSSRSCVVRPGALSTPVGSLTVS